MVALVMIWLVVNEIPVPNPLDFLEPGAVALLIAYLFLSVTTLALVLYKGWLVPKPFYTKLEEDKDKMVQIVEDLTKALNDHTDAVEELTKEVRWKQGGN